MLLPDPEGRRCRLLPGRYVERDVVQDLLPVEAVAEADMVEPDVALDRRQLRARRHVGPLAVVLRMSPSRCDREARLLEVLPHLRQAQDRRAHPAGQHVEGDQLADRQAAVDHQLGAEIEDGGGDHLADELTTWLRCCPGSSTRKLADT